MQYWQKLHEYFSEIDARLTGKYDITLIGGAALILEYNHTRVTYDLDVLNSGDARKLEEFIAKQKDLNEKYHLPFQIVDGSFFPLSDEYLAKRKKYSKGKFKHLNIYVLDIYDVIMSKLDRCDARDRDDIQWLRDNFIIDVDELIKTYKDARNNALNTAKVDANFRYILEVVFNVIPSPL